MKTLVILAAGLGSRFGGLKQVEGVGPNDEFIIDYSVYDAIEAGFERVIFIINEANLDIFENTISKRIRPFIKVEYAFQAIDDLPEGIEINFKRSKPWGTTQAIYALRNLDIEDFLIINADDFYGKDSFKKAIEFFNNRDKNEFSIVNFEIGNTLSENGAVKRGVCFTKDGYLKEILESEVEKDGALVKARGLNHDEEYFIKPSHPVSVNMMCVDRKYIEFIEKNLKANMLKEDNLETAEYLIVDDLDEGTEKHLWKVKMVNTTSMWYGMTYKEDKKDIQEMILDEIQKGNYPKDLWNNYESKN